MKTNTTLIAVLGGGLLAGIGIGYFLQPGESAQGQASAERKPLYWVAPMDANYRRDQPGKSPMGMDLVPVYAEDAAEEAPGTVTISPAVVNNLGVRTALVTRKSLTSEIRTVGYIQYNQDQLLHIHPRVEGWIETLYVKAAGERVTEGQPLYTLYSPQLVNVQEEYLLALKRDNPVLIKAAESRLSALQVSPRFVRELKERRQVMQEVTFYAPQGGVIDEFKIREGFFVKPGTTMMSIGRLDQVWVEAEVFERQAALVKQGQMVSMELDYLPGESWQGEVDYVYPTLDETTRTLRVRLRFANPDRRLKPNMFAAVTILADNDAEQLVVPKEAVIRTGSQDRVVLALGEGRFKSVSVTLGRMAGDDAVILAGLDEGDRVVSSAQFLLDSESSKSSDFKRMQDSQKPASVWTSGTVESLMSEHRMVTITHAPIPEWEWPEMTMDFSVAEDVDMSALAPGVSLHFELSETEEGLRVTGIHVMEAEPAELPSATVDGMINRIDAETRVLNISRGAIEKWGREPATLDFMLTDELDIDALKVGENIRFTFVIDDGNFVIRELHPAAQNGHDGH